jgi:hypothetical protein
MSAETEINSPVPEQVADTPAPTAYEPMADSYAASTEEPKKKTYDADQDGLHSAAKDLTQSRQPEPEPLERKYQWLSGEKAGEPIPENQTVSAERAARDVEMMRNYEASLQQTPQADVAAAIDTARAYAANPPQAQPDQDQAQAQQPTQPDGIDAEIAQALQNPKIRAALEAEVQAAEQARGQYAQAARAAAQITAASLLSNYPELASLTSEQIPHALAAISKVDPAKAQQIELQLGRVKPLHAASVEAEQAQQKIQAARFEQYAKAEDDRFEQAVASEPMETKRAVLENGKRVLAQYYDIDAKALAEAVQTNPALRSSSTQRMIFDLIKTKLAQESAASKVHRDVPPVQRPGVGRNHHANDEVDAAMAKFRANPSPKSAAALLIARRAAKQ